MRIKITGENNCARATRHLMRMAGFAVTEFLPVDAITQAPHFGYAITIEVSRVPSSGFTPDPAFVPDSGTSAGLPSSMPERSTHGQPASRIEEASALDKGSADASSPSSMEASGGKLKLLGSAGILPAAVCASDVENRRRDAGATPVHIHFDSVDGALEAAVLRHVTQLAGAPVIVDRPGGVVHSERELRIVIPRTGDEKADEAAAVAVEFGVLRGLLDLTTPRPDAKSAKSILFSQADAGQPAVAPRNSRSRGGWWRFGIFALAGMILPVAGLVHAFPRSAGGRGLAQGKYVEFRPGSTGFSLCGVGFDPDQQTKGTQAKACATGGGRIGNLDHTVTNGAYLRLATVRAARVALAAAPAQGEFATGQQTKITDGTNTLVIDPCRGQTKVYVSINQTANAQLAAGTASKKIYICSMHVVVAAATNVALVEGTGSVCATGTAGVSGFGGATAATGWNFAANGGIVLGNGDVAVGAEGTSGDNLCLYNSAAGQVSGGISYVVQ